MNISERIFSKMKEKNMTQKEFSKLTNIPESTISDWKKKGNTPGAEKLNDISRALGTSVENLLGVEETLNTVSDYAALTDEEKMLIELYRAASQTEKSRLISYASRLSKLIVPVTPENDKKRERCLG